MAVQSCFFILFLPRERRDEETKVVLSVCPSVFQQENALKTNHNWGREPNKRKVVLKMELIWLEAMRRQNPEKILPMQPHEKGK